MRKFYLGLYLFLGVPGLFSTPLFASCSFPPQFDVKSLSYRLERIDASVEVRLDFPQLSALVCDETKVSFGTLWTFDLPVTQPVRVRVTNLAGTVVQEYALYGEVSLKATATWAALNFFRATSEKKLNDYRFVSAELWSDGGFLPTPALTVEDGGQSRHQPAQMQTY